jgi:hypothetical protein
VDGKTSRGARRPDGTRVHLLGVAEHGGHLLDHLEVGVEHNETSHFAEFLEPLDLAGAVVTFDALHTALPWRQVPADSITREAGHGRTETRTVKAADVPRLNFPFARQAVKITRWRKDTAAGKVSRETAYAVTSLTGAGPPCRIWPGWSASTGPSRRTTTSGT